MRRKSPRRMSAAAGLAPADTRPKRPWRRMAPPQGMAEPEEEIRHDRDDALYLRRHDHAGGRRLRRIGCGVRRAAALPESPERTSMQAGGDVARGTARRPLWWQCPGMHLP